MQTKTGEQDRSYPLIQTKLFIPPLRPKLVRRKHLIEKLNRTADRKLTLISAPAGFGKTTLLGEWISDSEIPVAWISLDKGDNDPVQFIQYFVGALQSVDVMIGEGALTLLRNPQQPPIASILANLIRDIADIRNDFVIVLDDYQAIDTEEIHNIVGSLLDYMPATMRLVLATRVDPPLPMARLRGRNQMTELRVTDLSFTHDETVVFFNKMMKLGLTKQEIAILESRTEGWIAGLQLAALSMQGHKNIPAFIHNFAGDERHIVDYLAEEVLNLQPKHVQNFLLQTSILDRLSGPLCDFLTHQKSSHKILYDLERANLFILPLDNKRCWYRYHHLFLELLHNRLHQENPDLIPDLHLRAASWFEANGHIQEAVQHALRHPDLNRAAELIDRHAFQMLSRGEVQKMLEWFATLTESSMRSHPRLWIVKAWAMALMQREDLREEIESLLQQAENYLIESKADDDRMKIMHGHAASIRTLVMQSPFSHGHDPEKLIRLAQRAQTLLPEDDYAIRSANTLHIGFGHLELGHTQKAEDAFQQSYQQGIKGRNFCTAVYGPINRAWIALHIGNLDRMTRICQESLDEISRLVADIDHHLPVAGGLHILLGAAWFEQNKLGKALDALNYGLRLIQWTGEYEMHITGYTTLACLLYSQRRHNAAEEAIVALERSWPDGSFYTDALRMRLHFSEDRPAEKAIAKVRTWIKEVRRHLIPIDGVIRLVPLDAARQFQRLTWFRLNIALARAGRSMESLPTIMDRIVDLRDEADRHGFIKYSIELSILESLAHETMGEKDKALVPLKNAVMHGSQGGFVRIFVDGGQPIANLLEKILDTRAGVPRAYVKKLLSAFRLDKLIKTDDDLVERLSERELEVLRSIAAGLSNKRITEELFISMSTAKTHLRNIYSKLGVHSRTEAIARAKELGLL